MTKGLETIFSSGLIDPAASGRDINVGYLQGAVPGIIGSIGGSL